MACAATANFSLGAPKKPLRPQLFMPSQWRRQSAERPRRLTRKKIAQQIMNVILATPGTTVKEG